MSSTGARHRGSSVGRRHLHDNNTPGSRKNRVLTLRRRWQKRREGFIFELKPLCCAKPVEWSGVEWSGVEWSGVEWSEWYVEYRVGRYMAYGAPTSPPVRATKIMCVHYLPK